MIYKKERYIFLALLFLCNVLTIYAQENWVLNSTADGIEVYTSEGNSKYNSFKGHIVLESSIYSFVAFLNDIDEYKNWGYKTKEVSLLKKVSDTFQIYRVITKVSFPYKNRDGVYQNKFKWISKSNTLIVDIKTLDTYIPEDEDYVRVRGSGFWKVMVLPSGKLDITFQMQIDPGGNIPAWLVNMFIDTTPYHTLLNLRAFLKKEKYQNKTFSFIKL
ncbi:MAG: hypothetical protein BM564_13380 [Bacteroidetes bacterium MedPE-SWsnd-G2]|nr:MAG: hypothetical protein BM564_13380 [Bacteroidetes bacterium MedPE-SWsnd-G2]